MIRSWHPYEAAPEDHEFLQELAEVVRYPTTALGPTKAELEVRVAELRSLLKAAQRGELRNRQWDVVRRHPDLWELRWAWHPKAQVRLYFHEPRRRPGQTVAAHVHVKTIVPNDPTATTARQDAHMDLAHGRIVQGQVDDWGLRWSTRLIPE